MITETILEDAGWAALDLEALAERAARAALRHLGHDAAGFEIAVLGCSDARIATLNAEFRGKSTPTNVLSWPDQDLAAGTPGGSPAVPDPDLPGEAVFLGDIAIARETCAREAAEQAIATQDHVLHLIVHGVLHLLGYDHIREEDAILMEALESEILGTLGVADPYSSERGF